MIEDDVIRLLTSVRLPHGGTPVEEYDELENFREDGRTTGTGGRSCLPNEHAVC